MKAVKPALGAIAVGLLLVSGAVVTAPVQAQTQQQEVVYGSQLMTPQELRAYRLKMRQAKTVEERAQIRAEHHRQMQERAKERGVTLPEAPPPQGMHRGVGPGAGPGGGAGGAGAGRWGRAVGVVPAAVAWAPAAAEVRAWGRVAVPVGRAGPASAWPAPVRRAARAESPELPVLLNGTGRRAMRLPVDDSRVAAL